MRSLLPPSCNAFMHYKLHYNIFINIQIITTTLHIRLIISDTINANMHRATYCIILQDIYEKEKNNAKLHYFLKYIHEQNSFSLCAQSSFLLPRIFLPLLKKLHITTLVHKITKQTHNKFVQKIYLGTPFAQRGRCSSHKAELEK